MDVLDIARWQFGITTVYHFLMVPLTLGLGMTIAIMQSLWVRTGDGASQTASMTVRSSSPSVPMSHLPAPIPAEACPASAVRPSPSLPRERAEAHPLV